MEKKPFLTEAMAQQIIEDVPTPFHVYDEKGIRENVRRINKDVYKRQVHYFFSSFSQASAAPSKNSPP